MLKALVAASCRQLGVLAKTKSDLEAAEKLFLLSMAITKRLRDVPGMVLSALNLAKVASLRGDNDAAASWRTTSLQSLSDDTSSSVIMSLGSQAQHGGDFEAARLLYERAFDIASVMGDDETVSLSSLRMGSVACEMGDFGAAREHYERSIEVDERLDAIRRAQVTCGNLGRIYMLGGNGLNRDFQAAKRWFRKSLMLTRDASWWDFLVLDASLWYRRLQVRLIANSENWELVQDFSGVEKSNRSG